jgi:DNA polymerase I-like protein with 3'-5' exonuclease and polymerase domains
VPKKPKVTFIYDPTAEELEEYFDTKEIIYCDTESTGLNVRLDSIIGYSFCKDSKEAIAIVLKDEDDPRWPVVRKFFANPKRYKAWQNGSYDIPLAEAHDVPMKGFVYDTRLAEQLLNSDLPSDLDYLRAQYTNIAPYKPPKREMKRLTKWGHDRIKEYAAWDAYTTYCVGQEQKKVLTAPQLKLMDKLLIPLVYAISHMELRGVLADQKALGALYVQCEPRIQVLEKAFYKEGVNPRSPRQLAHFLGVSNTQEDTLKKLLKRGHEKHKLIELLLEHRKLAKMASTYISGIYNRLLVLVG